MKAKSKCRRKKNTTKLTLLDTVLKDFERKARSPLQIGAQKSLRKNLGSVSQKTFAVKY